MWAKMNAIPTISIIINTLNRGSVLQTNLESFRWLKYSGDFEVIVVNGPSIDNSDEVIVSWLQHIRTGKCDVANLSVSRNIGICMAQGDIIAFIDDDAIPEPEWLSQLAEAYKDPKVGAAGGLVYNHTGYDFQYKYCLVDRLGNADLSIPGPTPHLSFPKSYRFPHLLGCNSSFRRAALLEIGGFDEEYEYYLDETDALLRIVDAGYIVAQLPNAYVHHNYAPSNIRGENKVVRCYYPIIKNKYYFMLKHAKDFHSLERIMQEQLVFVQSQRNHVNWAHGQGLLADSDLVAFDSDVQRSLEVGFKRGNDGVALDAMINSEKLDRYSGAFLPFTLAEKGKYKSIILILRDFPPNNGGGIATFNKDLAEELASMGNLVHVITQSNDINRVYFERGVWVHRMVVREIERSCEALVRDIPQNIWNWSATALEETKRIATHRRIDLVEAPVWDCEGAAFLIDKQWPLVTSLQTTLYFWLESLPEKRNNTEWMAAFVSPMLAQQAEARAQQAEACAQQAEACAQQAEARAQQAEARAQQAEVRAQQAEAREQQAESRAQLKEARAQEVERSLSALEGSYSYQITFPLHYVEGKINNLNCSCLRSAKLKRSLRKRLVPFALYVNNHSPNLLKIQLNKFPRLKCKLKRMIFGKLQGIVQLNQDESIQLEDIEILTKRGRRIYFDLKKTVEHQQQEVR